MDRSRTVTTPFSSQAPIDDSRLGSYVMIALLARGGTASIYLAEHIPTGKRVALKLLDPMFAKRTDIVARFLAEHQVSRAVRHPGLLEISVSDTSASGVPYIVMELLDGESLGALLDRGLVDMRAILAIGTQIACAVAAMHRAGYAHCDLKPENVFVLYDENATGWPPKVKVIDYGVSRRTDALPDEDGTVSGTPAYMPPEQWAGAPSAKSDVYALGCMLYELATGEQPFHGTLPQLLILHTEQLPQRPTAYRSEMSPTFENLVMRMLAKDPDMRPTMDEVEQTLPLAGICRKPTLRGYAPMLAAG
ncbi:MAG: serine/threonine protein kinase [Kofleriaceae bacterium]|nr:serine/threonine protein kinase [Kofleriaceae bacterium]